MGRKSPKTIKNAKTPRHITEIAMTPERYYELKIYVKSLVLPGTPAFENKHLGSKKSKQTYRQWLSDALEEVGPRFFPGSANGLVWPEDRDSIYKAVHQVVRALSIGIRRNYKKRESRAVRAVRGESDANEMEMTQDDGFYEGKDADDNDVKGNFMIPHGYEKYARWGREEGKVSGIMAMLDQENQAEDTMEEEMDAEPIELEDLLGSMKPEVFAHFPNLDDEYFDWDELLDPKSPDPIARLLLLLS